MPAKCFEGGNTNLFLENREQFYTNLSSTVVGVHNYDKHSDGYTSSSGFCVDGNGLIMTCAHCIPRESEAVVVTFQESYKYVNADIVAINHEWDIALLRAQVDGSNEKDFVTFADDDQEVYCNEEVHSIGYLPTLEYSLMSGEVAFPCVFDNSGAGRQYEFDPNLDDKVMSYRCVGNVININERGNEDPHVRLIQTSSMLAIGGVSGSPLFNNKGHVIGMMKSEHGHHNLSIHYNALKKYFNGKGKGGSEDGSSKKYYKDPPEKRAREKRKGFLGF